MRRGDLSREHLSRQLVQLTRVCACAIVIGVAIGDTLQAQTMAPVGARTTAPVTSASQAAAPAESLGTLLADVRLRYEFGDREDLDAANAFTLRTRLGYESPAWRGFSGLFELQASVTPDEDAYDPYPGPQGAAGRTIITEGPDARINRAALQYRSTQIEGAAGRQRIILDNARFIGDVGWRQNAQMYDALFVTARPTKAIDVSYGYLGRAIRIFGSEADNPAQRRYDMRSQVLHGAWRARKDVSVTGYAYLLGITTVPGESSNTFGGFVTASHDVAGTRLSGRAELARQVDNGRSPDDADFGLNYGVFEGRARLGPITPVVGYEWLGGNGTRGFSTPLATLHAFNGWADVFLTTPPGGLRDLYVSGLFTLPHAFNTTVTFHRFTASHIDLTYGHELDVNVTRKLNALMSVGAKYAAYRGASAAPASVRPDLTRLILDLNVLWTHPLRRDR